MATARSRQRPKLDANALAGLARRVPVPAVRAGVASPGGALVVDQIMRMMPGRRRSGNRSDGRDCDVRVRRHPDHRRPAFAQKLSMMFEIPKS